MASPPPLHEIYCFAGPLPRRRAPWLALGLAAWLRLRSLLSRGAAIRMVATARSTAQMKPASSRAIATMATVLSLPFRISATIARGTAGTAPSRRSRERRRRRRIDLRLLGLSDPRRMLIAPRALHQHAAGTTVAGFGDRSALDGVAGRMLPKAPGRDRPSAQRGFGTARDRRSRPATRWPRSESMPRMAISAVTTGASDHVRNSRGDGLLQPGETLLRLTDRQQHLLEHEALLRMIELLARDPAHMRPGPGLLALRISAVPCRSRNAETCWRLARKSTAVSRARVRSRIAS